MRDLALFDLAIDSKLRGCDVVALRVGDILRPARNPMTRHCASAKDRAPGPV